jgi:hypothetical protein
MFFGSVVQKKNVAVRSASESGVTTGRKAELQPAAQTCELHAENADEMFELLTE